MGVIAIYSIFGFQYLTMMPVSRATCCTREPAVTVLLLTFVGVGALTGALSLAALGPRIRRGRLFSATAFAFSALTILFSFVRSVPLAAVRVVVPWAHDADQRRARKRDSAVGGARRAAGPSDGDLCLRLRWIYADRVIHRGRDSAVRWRTVGDFRGGGVVMLAYTLWAFSKIR